MHCDKHGDKSCFKVPPGWDDWHGLQGNSRYYNGTISDNGTPSVHGELPELAALRSVPRVTESDWVSEAAGPGGVSGGMVAFCPP